MTSPSMQWVERVITAHQSSGDAITVVCGPAHTPRPATDTERAQLETIGVALPPSFLRWITFDIESLDLFDADGNLFVTTPAQFLAEEMAEALEFLDDFEDIDALDFSDMLGPYAHLADTPCLVLPPSASQAHLLVLEGTEDEPPVLGFEKEEFWEKYKNFGAFVAHTIGGVDEDEVFDD